jgi:hypothetical protein
MKMPWLIWVLRVIIMLYALFTVLFSFDVFGGPESIWQQLLGFLIHNIFFLVLSLILVATWYRPLIAGILFIAFSVALTVMFYDRGGNWAAYLMIKGPPLIVGVLYIIVHFIKKKEITEEKP